jgi:hypothetical protein
MEWRTCCLDQRLGLSVPVHLDRPPGTELTAALLRPPLPRVSEAMAAIWSSLVDDTRAARESRGQCLAASRQRLRHYLLLFGFAQEPEPCSALTQPPVDAHFDAIVADLMREMGGRTWKGRQAATAALGDLLQGRRWDQLGPHITEVGQTVWWGWVERRAWHAYGCVCCSAAGCAGWCYCSKQFLNTAPPPP